MGCQFLLHSLQDFKNNVKCSKCEVTKILLYYLDIYCNICVYTNPSAQVWIQMWLCLLLNGCPGEHIHTLSPVDSNTHVILSTVTNRSSPTWWNKDILSVCGVCVRDPGWCEDQFPLPQSTNCVNGVSGELRCTHTGDRSQRDSGRCSWASS